MANITTINGEIVPVDVDQKLYPHSVQLEQTVLASCIRGNADSDACIEAVQTYLTDYDFFRQEHKIIFNSACALHNDGVSVDIVNLAEYVTAHYPKPLITTITKIGDPLAVFDRPETIKERCESLRQLSVRRYTIQLLESKLAESRDLSQPIENIIDSTDTKLVELQSKGAMISDIPDIRGSVQQAMEAVEGYISGATTRMKTGIKDYDAILRGFGKGSLNIIAGRPSMGKTELALNIALNVMLPRAQQETPKKVLLMSLEMTKEEVLVRFFSNLAGIESNKFAEKDGITTDDEWSQYFESANRVANSSLVLEDRNGYNVAKIRAFAKKIQREQGLDIIIIDQLNFIETDNPHETLNNQVGQVSRGMKNLAKELDIPVVLVCQLSRKCEDRNNKRPMLSDLRDSGNIEQDADTVTFVYREEYYDPETEARNIMELIVAKGRNSGTGTAKVYYNSALHQIRDAVFVPISDNEIPA